MNDQNTTPDPDAPEKPDANSRSHISPGSAVLPLAMSIMASAGGWAMPSGLRMTRRHSSYRERHHPNRKKTPEDLERIEAARRKRERKAAKGKLLSQNDRDHTRNEGSEE